MGVKDLWQVLAPVCERKSLWELEGKTLAIDLSGWVCDSQTVVEHSSQPNMHLRNLFFRTSCLLLLGARPIFVLEGTAPDLKLDTIHQRNNTRGFASTTSKSSGKRRNLKSVQKQCQEMLKCMGVNCIEGLGEAEALCALLNEKGLVDGCVTQDSDCFLYGGRTIYRNFTISSSGGTGGPSFSVDVYKMDKIEEVLGLTRKKLIGLSLLCGCDYNQGGVSGVGKESAVKFLTLLKDHEVFSRFQSWRDNERYDQLEKERTFGICDKCGHYGKQRQHDKSGCSGCGTSKKCFENASSKAVSQEEPEDHKSLLIELSIRRKALQDPNFPSQDVIDEYLGSKDIVPKNFSCEWSQPNLVEFMKMAQRKLNWDENYSLVKFLPVLTRWVLLWKNGSRLKSPIYPKAILKTRLLKGIASFEVEWGDKAGLFEALKCEEESEKLCVTIEPQELFQEAYPELTQAFRDKELEKKKSKKKVGTKKKTVQKKVFLVCDKCGKEFHDRSQKCLCKFLKETSVPYNTGNEKSLEEMLDNLYLQKIKDAGRHESLRIDKNKPSLDAAVKETIARKEYFLDTKQPQAPLAMSFEDKFSFEELLQGEKCSAADFLDLNDLNLSDAVQSITGQEEESHLKIDKRQKNMISGEDDMCQDFEFSVNACLTPETTLCVTSTSPVCIAYSLKNQNDASSTSVFNPPCSSSDEEYPYTPLMERVRSLRERAVKKDHQSNVFLPSQAKRFSESFDSFCVGTESFSSSPKSSESIEGERSPLGSNFRATFSLGVSDLLESTF